MKQPLSKLPTILAALLGGTAIILFSLWFGQNNTLMPESASQQAPLVDQLFNVMVTIGMALFIIVQGAIVYSMFKFRKPEGDETDGSDLEGNIPLEIVWTAIPAVIVIGLGIYSVQVYQEIGGFTAGSAGMAGMSHNHTMSKSAMAAMPEMKFKAGDAIAAPAPKPLIATTFGIGEPGASADVAADVVVNVTGMQFAWLFEYPDQGVTVGELHVPVGKRVKLQMKAVDVLHAFWVPQFRLKQDVMPGLDSELQFVATKTGTFPVFCAELCGAYHGSMQTQTIVEEPEVFEKWLLENKMAQAEQRASAVAFASPHEMNDADFLKPYAHDLGVDQAALSTLQ
jgi:cytochrome c oxidase subunit II